MAIGPRQGRKKQGAGRSGYNRYAIIGLVVAVVAIGVYFTASPSKPGNETVTAVSDSLSRLYAEADADFDEDKLGAAASKFRQVANVKSDFRDADARAEEISQTLLKQGVELLESGDLKGAKVALEAAVAADPTNTEAKIKEDEVDNEIDESGGDPDVGGGENPDSDPEDPDDDSDPVSDPDDNIIPKIIPDDATPLSLLPQSIDGYRVLDRKWINKPYEAGSTLIPKSAEMRADIDQILLTIRKHDDGDGAAANLDNEEGIFPMEGEDISINKHPAYTGLYNFSGSSSAMQLRQITTLAWTRDNWFFSVQVLPKGTPDAFYKKGVARDAVLKLGY